MKIIEHNQRLINVVYSLWFSHIHNGLFSGAFKSLYQNHLTHHTYTHTLVHGGYIVPYCYYYYYYHISITILSSRIDNVRWCDIIAAAAAAAATDAVLLLLLLPLFCAPVVYVYTTWVYAV